MTDAELREAQRERLRRILNRHVRAEDASLTDHGLVQAAIKRYTDERGQPLIDPNE